MNNKGYGFSLNDPIQVTDISAEYIYLNSLFFEDGTPICYERIGSYGSAEFDPVDKYLIYRTPMDKNNGVEPVTELYIYGYADENTMDAPEGFILKIEHPDIWLMPPVWK